MSKQLSDLGVEIPSVLLPAKNVDLGKWSVVACDQYTSQPDYWSDVSAFVGENPSTLKMVLPEIYLGDNDSERIDNINTTMGEYLIDDVLETLQAGFIFVDRKTSGSESKKGLIMALDLEKYDYSEGSQSLIRATEGTLIERLPPRVKIRENAPLELPHITILIDDPQKILIEPLFENSANYEKLYDFDLMMGGGHIKGYMINDAISVSAITGALIKLSDNEVFKSKYGVGDDNGVLLFAVGDGNHSLATAKVCWENKKRTLTIEEQQNHPARFALVEVQNIHDDSLKFEPIHRVVFNIDEKEIIRELEDFYKNKAVLFSGKSEMKAFSDSSQKAQNSHVISFVTSEGFGSVAVENPQSNLEVATLHAFLDSYIKNHNNIVIDYIHGEEVVDSLGSQKGNIGFYISPINKNDLFKTIIKEGVLPRKTFSMGNADEKRFYLECRKIK